MNTLYWILTSGVRPLDKSDFYYKVSEPVLLTQRMTSLRDAIMSGVPVNRVPEVACFICGAAIHTQLGKEIMELDSNNTYTEFEKDPGKAMVDTATCIYDMVGTYEDARTIIGLLDQDLKDSLVVPSWIESMSAACLQLLRLNNGNR